ncbi:MAG: ComEA family DNA-binding protein [Oscillospiraceae bacterium]|nr:ComEA family DNA-binding protein [Oscillospiraceae bacterium]
MKKAFFPLISLVFIIACAVFVYLAREAEPVYVRVAAPVAENGTTSSPSIGQPQNHNGYAVDGIVGIGTPLVNINTADLEELMTLQGIGPAIGQRIIDYREDSGLFMAVEEIMEVSGIGEVVFANIRDRITID